MTDYNSEEWRETEAELERWREAGKEVGRQLGVIQERKRIIDLFESMAYQGDPDWDAFVHDAVAIIKGEDK
jgi:hypothetical protein